MEVKNRWTNEILYSGNFSTTKDIVEDAVKKSADLHSANLKGADLSNANLKGADLSNANLKGADLSNANLYGADLSNANLYGANLSNANLYGANLEGANLSGANLYGANLEGANLSGANLEGANLEGADFYGADLKGANLEGADFYGADLKGANLTNFQIIPDEGEFLCYKKVFQQITKNPIILTLKIPENAKRNSCLINRKCRVSSAIPIKAEDFDGNIITDLEFKNWNSEYPYIWKMNQENFPENGYSDDIRIDCAPGLHVFVTKKEAKEF